MTRILTDRWQWSGVAQFQTGAPFTPGYSVSGAGNSNITGSNTEGSRIGLVKGCNPYTGSDDPFNRLNASCFFAPSPGSIGTESGVNFLYAPGVANFDMAIQKDFALAKEGRVKLQFRNRRVQYLQPRELYRPEHYAQLQGLQCGWWQRGWPATHHCDGAGPK